MESNLIFLSKIFSTKYTEFIRFLGNINLKNIFMLSKNDLISLNIDEKLIPLFFSEQLKKSANDEYLFCKKNNIKIVSYFSKEYPVNLKHIASPPPILYYKGTFAPEDECSVSIVGSRKYSEYGKNVTIKLTSELASAKVAIVSGMARGIDSFSHITAIKNNSRTLAILGSGIDVIYPEENKNLYNEITENGAVISEFPLHTPPKPENFPIRNRIVAGLSLGTLVIEANEKSGTMITARLAAEAGREVYAVPGSIFNPTSIGTNLLIRDGAKIVTSSKDILEDIYLSISQVVPKPKQLNIVIPENLSKNEKMIYNLISLEPVTSDFLFENLNLPVSEIISTLSMLELEGYIVNLPNNSYVRTMFKN